MIPVGRKLEVRECIFEIEVTEGTANIRFPCSFYFEWKTANGKHSVVSQHKVKVKNGLLPFNDSVQLTVLMIYDARIEQYKKK